MLFIIQAVLARNYYQTVATIYVGRDRFNDEYIQIVGDESIYGYNYIIEPVFRRRPVIVRWLWTWDSHRYVSPYYWGYYPRHYRVHHIIALPAYHNRVKRYVDHRHQYRRIEKDNRRINRDNKEQIDRRTENRNYQEADRREGNSRIQNEKRNDRQPEISRPNNRQTDPTPSRQPEVKRSENRRPDSTPTRSTEVKKSESSSSRESVRETRTSPQRTSPAASGNRKASERENSKSERR